jgi:hypothetical protein
MIEKITTLRKVCKADTVSDLIAAQFSDYAEFLASQGQLELAERYLNMIADPQLPSAAVTAVRRDRVYHRTHAYPDAAMPAFPFAPVYVDVAPVVAEVPVTQQSQSAVYESDLFNQPSTQAAGFIQPAAHTNYQQPAPAQQNPYQPPAQQNAYQQPAQQNAYQPPAQQNAYQQPAQQSAYQPPAQQNAYQQPAQQNAYQPPAQQNAYQPPAQQNAYQKPAQQNAYQPAAHTNYQQPAPAQQNAYQPPAQQNAYQQPAAAGYAPPPAAHAASKPGYSVFTPQQPTAQEASVQPPSNPGQAVYTQYGGAAGVPAYQKPASAANNVGYQPAPVHTQPISQPAHAPVQQLQPQPVAPPAAPKVLPAQFEPIARILKGFSAQLATQMPKRKHDDLERRLQQLSEKLTSCQLSDATCHRLLNLCGALQRQDLRSAAEIQTEMTTKDWDENGFWLVGIKWMIDGK